MRRTRLPIGLAVSVLLLGLVALFATLQYRWLGQASEADRAQMRRSLNDRAQQFASDFDREIGKLQVLAASREGAGTTDAERVADRIARWRKSTLFSTLVRDVHTVRVEAGTPLLFHFSPERAVLEPVAWPDRFASFRARVETHHTGEGLAIQPFSGITPINQQAPAVLIPPRGSESIYTIADLEPAVLRTVLTELTQTYFDEKDGDPYRVAILDAAGQPFFTSDDRAADIGRDADASAMLFQPRPTFVAQNLTSPIDVRTYRLDESPSRGTSATRALVFGSATRVTFSGRAAPPPPSTWTLVLQHPRGSIDAAVNAGRRRNLWVSFGILSLMIAGMALVMVNARRSQRLAAQQMEFVTTVSHELRTPVAAMRAAAQNLSAGVVPDPERIRLYGDLIENEGRRLTEMVEQVLEFAGTGGDRLLNAVPVQLREIVERAVESCRPQTDSAGCTVDLDIAGDLPAMIGEANALQRAVSNLMTNAVKHGADGHWVGVSVRAIEGNGGRPEVEIAVSDRGQGVDPEDLPRIFEPFYRGRRALDRQIQGSGLGLSLVRRIAEAHGGCVTAQSVSGTGATFTIHLPA